MKNNYFEIKKSQIDGRPLDPMMNPSNPPMNTSMPPNNKEQCPECGGEMSDWNRDDVDEWDYRTDRPVSRPGNSEYRVCLKCGNEEEKDIRDQVPDPYDVQEDKRMMGANSYFDIKKESQITMAPNDTLNKVKQVKQLLDEIAGDMQAMPEGDQKDEISNRILDIYRTLVYLM